MYWGGGVGRSSLSSSLSGVGCRVLGVVWEVCFVSYALTGCTLAVRVGVKVKL